MQHLLLLQLVKILDMKKFYHYYNMVINTLAKIKFKNANKWQDLKKYENVKLHMIGKLQSNKVRDCLKYFDYIHSLDSKKLAKIYEEQLKQNKKPKIFIQTNIGEENQKSGIGTPEIDDLLFCNSLELDIRV